MAYYYRGGERVPVSVTASARVAPESSERELAEVPSWTTRPLAPGYVLVLREDVRAVPVGERGTPSADKSVTEEIVQRERALRRNFPAQGTSLLDERAELVTFPVIIDSEHESVLFATGDVVADFPLEVAREQVENLVRERGWAVTRTVPYLANGYVLSPAGSADPLALANHLVEDQGALIAHPIFLEEIPDRVVTTTSEPAQQGGEFTSPPTADLFRQEWHLSNVGQNGAIAGVDVRAPDAWRVTAGSPEVAICIIDSGVDLEHEVFSVAGKLGPGYDFVDKDAAPTPMGSSHGTACAAVAAANGRVLGVAPLCKIVPVRRTAVTDHLALSDALVWAADAGADVINCSWGIDGRPWVLPDVVKEALSHVTTHGRGGRGCAIFWAAGNGDEPVSGDEWASSPYTIAVAASTDQGRRAGYSDFGPEIAICAPSSGGVNGISTAVNGGYTIRFGGTSSAAPLAAGVAALVLSLAPNLRWHELRDLLCKSARKVDPDGGSYDERGHSAFFGYGQVDAYAALLAIDAYAEVLRTAATEGLRPDLDSFFAHLARRSAGRVIIDFVRARRLELLRALRQSSELVGATGYVLRLMADLGRAVAAGRPAGVPAVAWPALTAVATALASGRPLPDPLSPRGR